MSYINGCKNFLKILLTPKVIVLILIGTAVMFLTFLTQDNALELGISGIASVFIGIGVNNFTAIETEKKEELRLKLKLQNTINTLIQLQKKVIKIESIAHERPENIMIELQETKDYVALCIHYLDEK